MVIKKIIIFIKFEKKGIFKGIDIFFIFLETSKFDASKKILKIFSEKKSDSS